MATKLQAVIGLSDKLTSDLTTRRGAWRQYLNTAARVYKYSFADQLLIYGQRPDATACAELPLWNEKMGRWVNRGAHGIALIDTSRRRPRLRYVFDVSDTHLSRDGSGRTLRLWTIRPDQHEAVSAELERMYPDAGITGLDFTEKITKICELAVKDQLSYYLERLEQVKAGSLLEELDSLNLSMWLRLPLEASVGYTVLTRCGIDSGLYYDDVDFEKIYDFSTLPTVTVLGNATSNISRTLLLELGKLARSLTRQRQPRRKPPVPARRPTPPRQKPERTQAPTVQSDTKPETEAEQVSVSGVSGDKAPESSMQEAPEEMPPAEADTPSEPETMAAAEPETPEAPALSAPVAPEVSAEPEPAHHIPLGSTVYIGEKEYELLAYGGENVTLYDPDCPLFNEVMSRSEFDAKLAENPLNSHLFTAHVDTPEVTEQTSAPEQAEAEATLEPEQAPTIQLAPPPAVRRHSKVSPTVLHPEIPAEQRHNYRIHDDALGAGTPGEKFNRNIRAIRLLKKLEAEDRFATS